MRRLLPAFLAAAALVAAEAETVEISSARRGFDTVSH